VGEPVRTHTLVPSIVLLTVIITFIFFNSPSQLKGKNSMAVAQMLSETLQANGDFYVAAPNFSSPHSSSPPSSDSNMDMDVDMTLTQNGNDEDQDIPMPSAGPPMTQFSQTLMLFSQTQHGTRHSPSLTRFYSTLPPDQLLPLIQSSLEVLNVSCKVQSIMGVNCPAVRVGGMDKRKEAFRGWVVVEPFSSAPRGGYVAVKDGSFVRMNKDNGNPISWRQLWKALIMSPGVEPHVLRRR
jgi:serine/threonine-protein kinase CHEK1